MPGREPCGWRARPSAAIGRRARGTGARRASDGWPRACARSHEPRPRSPAQRRAGRRAVLARRPARGRRARRSRRPIPNTASRNDPVWVVSRLIDSRMPTAARLMVSAEPPALMNGSGMPVTGRSAVTTIMLTRACDGEPGRDAAGQQAREGVGRRDRDPVALVGDDDEERHDGQRADEAPLLADDGEDEVGRGRRQVQELLLALAEAEAGDAAERQRDRATGRCCSRHRAGR